MWLILLLLSAELTNVTYLSKRLIHCYRYRLVLRVLHSMFAPICLYTQVTTCCSSHRTSRVSSTLSRSPLGLARPRRNPTTLLRSRSLQNSSPKYATGYVVCSVVLEVKQLLTRSVYREARCPGRGHRRNQGVQWVQVHPGRRKIWGRNLWR